jgi:hypothetical protein
MKFMALNSVDSVTASNATGDHPDQADSRPQIAIPQDRFLQVPTAGRDLGGVFGTKTNWV